MYTIEKALLTTKQVELVEKKEFAAVALDPGCKIFVVYVTSFKSLSNNQKSNVHLFCIAKIVVLVANKASILIFIEYSNFANIFFPELALEFSKYTRINDYAIELVND